MCVSVSRDSRWWGRLQVRHAARCARKGEASPLVCELGSDVPSHVLTHERGVQHGTVHCVSQLWYE
jgi:hypothetical protein